MSAMLAILGMSSAGWACLSEAPAPFSIDAALEDGVPPWLEDKDHQIGVWRGRGPTCLADGSVVSTSCDGRGNISVQIPAAVDDAAPLAADAAGMQVGVGYRLRVISGAPPAGLLLLEEAQEASFQEEQVQFSLVWDDGAEDTQETFQFVLGIQAVDQAGNWSEEIALMVADPGRSAEEGSCWGVSGSDTGEGGKRPLGCAAVGGPGGRLLPGVGLLWLLGRRRSPARHGCPARRPRRGQGRAKDVGSSGVVQSLL